MYHFLGWVQTLTTPVVTGQALTTFVETCGTWNAATPKMAKDGWSLLLSSDGQTTVLSVSLNPSYSRLGSVRLTSLLF